MVTDAAIYVYINTIFLLGTIIILYNTLYKKSKLLGSFGMFIASLAGTIIYNNSTYQIPAFILIAGMLTFFIMTIVLEKTKK